VTVPPDMTVEAEGPGGAAVTYTASATDFQGRPLAVNCGPPSGSTFPLGATVVTCSATHGNETTTKSFTITVADRTPPTLTVPADKSLRTKSVRGVPVIFSASAIDIVDGAIEPTCTPASGSLFPSGTTTVSCNAGDRHGNVATGSFAVSISIVRAVRRAALFSPAPGAFVSGPTMLAWRAVPRARFYNVQLHRNGRKVLTRWPKRPRFMLRSVWRHEGRTYRLRRGVYTWFVWPAFGVPANPRFGKLLGRSSFRVV
jgi:HYR domain